MRLAERADLDDDECGVVYYTALLVNVGCHADAHEQAKWFGDDTALKAGKGAHELGSLRGAAATLRLLGAMSALYEQARPAEYLVVLGRKAGEMLAARGAVQTAARSRAGCARPLRGPTAPV
jgi:hypothetical protein